jgi:hypothetical protein
MSMTREIQIVLDGRKLVVNSPKFRPNFCDRLLVGYEPVT